MQSTRKPVLQLVAGLMLCGLAPLLLGFLCFPLIAPAPSGVVTPTPAALFAPTVSAAVPNGTPAARSNVVANLAFPAGSTLAIGATFDVPAGWTVASDAGVTTGSLVGSIVGSMTVADPAFFSCNTGVSLSISLIEATTNTANTVSGADTDGDGLPQVIEDNNANLLPDGVDSYPAFLSAILPGTHKARYFGYTEAAGLSDIYVNVIVAELAFGGPYRVIAITNDPTSPPESAAEQFCAPQSLSLVLFGTSADNPLTLVLEGGQAVYTNPATTGTYTFRAQLVSEFDRDNDGVGNGLDNCPATANTTQTDTDQDYIGDACEQDGVENHDVDGDGIENGYDNCVFVANSATAGPNNQADADYDDLGDSCDPSPSVPTGPNYYMSCTDPVGIGRSDPGGATCAQATPAPTPTPKSATGDTDGDTFPNGSDADDDNDGCTDVQEVGTNQALGGRRNPHNHWDFYDIDANKTINVFGDIIPVASAYGDSSGPNYTLAKDRSRGPPPGKDPNDPANNEPWDQGPPDGAINVFDDILGVAQQFGHSCVAPP